MNKILTKAGIILLAVLMTNCASIIHGNMQDVDFSSQPPGAKVYIDGKEYGTTPITLPLYRKGRTNSDTTHKMEYNVKIELEGYYPYEIKIKRTVDEWVLGNLIIGGLIGIFIDCATGSMYKLYPDQIIAFMGKESANIKTSDGNIIIAATLNVDPNWEKFGQLEKE